ncbi:MAG: hypothetical protein IPK13_20260 [Deltaproteobacteria bacterium]|nr:hypothetical protein [Deltaproteobacteria bacterium]
MESLRLAPASSNTTTPSGSVAKKALRRTPLLAPEASPPITVADAEKTCAPITGSKVAVKRSAPACLAPEEGAVIAALATLNHWEDERLAAHMGWSRSHLSNVLRGKRPVVAEDRERLIAGVRSVPLDPFHHSVQTSDGYTVYLPKQEDLSGPHPFESFGSWVTEIGFGSLLDHPIEVMNSHRSIDRLLVTAEPRDVAVALLDDHLPPLTKEEREELRKLDPRERRQHLRRFPGVVIDDRGERVPIEWTISEIDVHEPYNRSLRFKRNVEVMIAGTEIVLAVLSLGPSRKSCKKHRTQRGEHKEFPCARVSCTAKHFWRKQPERVRCGSCSFDNDHFWKCQKCLNLNECAACDALTAAQPGLRLDITGTAWRRGLANGLLDLVRQHFAVPGSIAMKAIDLAIDVEAPFAALVPFARPDMGWKPRSVEVERMPIGRSIVPTGAYLGGASLHCCIYDVLAAAKHFASRRGRRYELPEHARGAEHLTRFELRLRLQKGRVPEDIVQKAIACFDSLAVADLRRADPAALHAPFLVMATEHGIQPGRSLSLQKVRQTIGRPPARKNKAIVVLQKGEITLVQKVVKKQLQKSKLQKKRRRPLDMAEVLLDRLGAPQRTHRIAEERARMVRDVVLEDLTKLAVASGVWLGEVMKNWAPELRAFLDAVSSSASGPEAEARRGHDFWMQFGSSAAIAEPAALTNAADASPSELFHAALPAPPGGLRWTRPSGGLIASSALSGVRGGPVTATGPEDLDAVLEQLLGLMPDPEDGTDRVEARPEDQLREREHPRGATWASSSA